MSTSKCLFPLLAVVAALVCAVLYSQSRAADVSQQAEFIVKLIDYVEWPAGKGTDASGAIVIACVGESPLAAALKEKAAAKSADGVKITVKIAAPTDPLSANQMVIISNCDKAELAKVLKSVAGGPTLTVSACTGFAKFGVMVNILDQSSGSKINFEVNTITLKEAGLKIGSQLLKLATVI